MTPYVNMLFPCDRRLVILFFGGEIVCLFLFVDVSLKMKRYHDNQGLVCFPLSCLRRMSSLKFTSMVGLFFIIYLVGSIVISCIVSMSKGMLDMSKIELARLDANFLSILPIISFAFTFHTNLLLIWQEMKEFPNSSRNVRLSTSLSTSACACVGIQEKDHQHFF